MLSKQSENKNGINIILQKNGQQQSQKKFFFSLLYLRLEFPLPFYCLLLSMSMIPSVCKNNTPRKNHDSSLKSVHEDQMHEEHIPKNRLPYQRFYDFSRASVAMNTLMNREMDQINTIS
ncbi:hypothetical protein [Bacillus changyiensis]|nr:hypothetical protein [Bacillus changyiensis]MDA1475753.1 hypothetical protein [Bacillus changyiensis]